MESLYSPVFSSNKTTDTVDLQEAEELLLLALTQPMTATQLARTSASSREQCSFLLRRLAKLSLSRCITPRLRRNRLFWPTSSGRDCQELLAGQWKRNLRHDFPLIDWYLYAQVCYSQRAAVVKHLSRPMQPVQIRRAAVSNDSSLKLSANNVRDVMRFLRLHRIVEVVEQNGQYALYDLSEEGKHMQRLLIQADR